MTADGREPAVQLPSRHRPGSLSRRLAWFGAYWLGGVLVLLVVSAVVRWLIF